MGIGVLLAHILPAQTMQLANTLMPPDVMQTLYNWAEASDEQLAKTKLYLVGRIDVLLDIKFYGDVCDGTASIECTVLEPEGIKGNLYNLGKVVITRNHISWSDCGRSIC